MPSLLPTPYHRNPTVAPSGDSAVRIEFARAISPDVSARVAGARAALIRAHLPTVTDIVPAYSTITVNYDPVAIDAATMCSMISRTVNKPPGRSYVRSRRVEIPVVYGGSWGEDLDYVAEFHGLTVGQVIAMHSAPEYPVNFVGFQPGFPYLSGLPDELATPRLETPRTFVAAGSVGIAGNQTGIYPMDSPGGWRIIGRTPLALYLPHQNPPSLLRAGDRLVFVPIDDGEYAAIARRVQRGAFKPRIRRSARPIP